MNSKTRVFSFILAICLILNSGMSTSVFGANGSGFWLFSSGSRNSDESSIAANREENGASDTDIVDNADEITEYEEDTDEQDDAPVISDELVGDMLVYKDDAPENGTVAEEVSLVYEDDDIFVTLTGAQEDLPEDGSLEVSEVRPTDNKSAEAFANAFTALTEKLQERGENYSDAKLYDFTIYDAYGMPVEPDGPVSVRIEYKSPDAFADISRDSIRVAHIIENKDEEEAQADSEDDMTENDAPEVDDEEIVGAAAQRRKMFVEDTPSDELYVEDAEAVDIEEELVGASDEEPAYAEEELVGESDAEPVNAEEELVDESDAEPVDIEEQLADASDEVPGSVTAEIVETTVEQADSEPVELSFITSSFSYYIVFGGAGSDSEPMNINNTSWIRFVTSGKEDTTADQTDPDAQWGYYGNTTPLPELVEGNENAYKRIVNVRLWKLKNGGNPDIYDANNYEQDSEAKYFWTWQNYIVIDEFEIPGYEVAHVGMHTAWSEQNNEPRIERDSLEGSYPVRGYRASTLSSEPGAVNSDLNIVDVYTKKLPTPPNDDTTHYVIRYVHADGTVSDGNEKELWANGNNRVYFDQEAYCRDDEIYSGLSIATGVEAITDVNGRTDMELLKQNGKGYISFNSNVDLAKVTIYYKIKPRTDVNIDPNNRGHYDHDDNGYYIAEKGLYTDKNVVPIENSDGRHYMLNLESWYVDDAVSVGMVLDSSGSMAWTSGVPEPILLSNLDLAQWQLSQLRNYTSKENPIPLNTLDYILNREKTDNTTLNYNGYHYYLKDTRSSVMEYVAIGYTNGNKNGNYTQLSSNGYAYANWGTATGSAAAGWYYVNSGGNTTRYLERSGKSYDGYSEKEGNSWTRKGPLRFYVDGDKLMVAYYDPTSGAQQIRTSQVYEKRYKMFTKNETLQDALSQFGAILLGSSTISKIAMTRFSQDVRFPDGEDQDNTQYFPNLSYLRLMNWSDDTIQISGIMNHTAGEMGNNQRPYPDLTYPYGLTGQTTTYVGVKAFERYYQNDVPPANRKYVIIFTDGKDQYHQSGASDADKPNQGITGQHVAALKNAGFKIVTVLMKSQTFTADPTGYAKTQNFLRALASYGKQTDDTTNPDYESDDNKLYFEADSNSSYELVQAFREIASRITAGLNGYTVRDYIDPRFDVTNEAGDILTVLDSDGEFKQSTNPDVDENGIRSFTTPDHKQAYLGYDAARQMFYVEWRTQDIPSSTLKSSNVNTWSSQVRIQAKQDFLGGNDILTNGNDPTLNKVYFPGKDTNSSEIPGEYYPAKVFPQTSANPAILDESLDYTEDTIYLGEAIDPADKFKWLFETPQNDNLYIEYLKRYRETAEYFGSDGFRQSAAYTSLDNAHKVKIDAFVDTYEDLKDDIADFKADGARDIEATDDDPETKEKLTLNIPYYYLEDSRGKENQPGTIWHMLDKIGTISYTWDVEPDVPDPYIKRPTTENDPNPIVYRLKVSYKADSVATHAAGASELAAEDMDGILPNYGQYFNLRAPTPVDPEDATTHNAGTVYQTVSEGNSPVITKRVYLSELENDPDDSSDIASTLVDKVMHYLQDAESNTNGQKDYPFTVSDGTNTVSVTLRIKKPAEGAGDDVKLAYQWITKSGDEEVVLAEGNLTTANLLAAAAKGYINFSYTVTDLVVPDDNNPNTKNTKQYTVTDANAGKAISNIASGSISLVKHINKTQVLNDIGNESKQGVLLEFKLKRTYIDPMYEPDPTPTPDPGATPTPIPTPDPDATPTPIPGQVNEYYKLRLVLGGEPLPTPTPTPDPNATETPTPDPDVTVTPTPSPTPSPTPIPYD